MTTMSSESAPVVAEETSDFWSNPVDHFRPNLKFLTLYYERQYMVDKMLHIKENWLSPWFIPWWTPAYQIMTWWSQRNRNLLLVENHLNYRPYQFRRNDEDRNNPY